MKTQHLVYVAAVSLAALAAQIAFADTPANISVEGRGLPQVQGIVRDSSKVEWGFVNFVAFGPNWAYTAQDYAAKEHKKEPIDDPALGRGLLFTAKIWAGSRGLSIREEFYDVSKAGEAKAHARWKIASLDGKPMALERAYIRFPLPLSDFAGGTVSGKPIPAEYGDEWIGVGGNHVGEVEDRALLDVVLEREDAPVGVRHHLRGRRRKVELHLAGGLLQRIGKSAVELELDRRTRRGLGVREVDTQFEAPLLVLAAIPQDGVALGDGEAERLGAFF